MCRPIEEINEGEITSGLPTTRPEPGLLLPETPFLGIIRFYQRDRDSLGGEAVGIAAILPQSSSEISSRGRMVPSDRTTP